ncbi:MAG: SMP-30/gluconolactonase/LRE family protein [Phycisphaerae bacterium]
MANLTIMMVLTLSQSSLADEPESLQFGKFVAQFETPHEPAGLAFADADLAIAFLEAPFVHLVPFADIEKNSTVISSTTSPDDARIWPVPGAIASTPTGNSFFVVETRRAQVQHVGENISATWGKRGVGPGEFAVPRAIACDKSKVYVADTGNHRVQVFDYDGKHLLTFGEYGGNDGQFTNPRGIAVDASGNIYVADTDHHRIQKFDGSGKHLLSFGARGYYPGLLAEPCGIAVYKDELFVADRMNHRIQVFDLDGQVRYEWGLHVVKPGQGEGHFHYPDSIAISRDGKYAAVGESFQNRVQVFTTAPKDTSPIAGWQQTEPGQSAHFGEKIHIDGRLLFTSEPETSRVRIFDQSQPTPIEITNLGAYGRTPGRFITIGGMTYDPERDWLFVCDPAGRRISVWHIDHRSETTLRFNPQMARFLYEIDVSKLKDKDSDSLKWAVTPEDIVRLPEERLGVLDAANGQLVVMTYSGEFVSKKSLSNDSDVRVDAFDLAIGPVPKAARNLPIIAARHGAGALAGAFIDSTDGKITVVDISAQLEPAVAGRDIAGIAIAPPGEVVFATDQGNAVFLASFRTGARELSQEGTGLGRKQFYKPRGIAVDDNGAITIVDWGHHRLQTLSPKGEFLRVFGSRWYCEDIKRSEEGMPEWPYSSYSPAPTSQPVEKKAKSDDLSEKTATADVMTRTGPLERCRVSLRTNKNPVPMNQLFDLEVEVNPLDTEAAKLAIGVDADMPAHRHGMLVSPEVEEVSPRKYAVRGMNFHMPGYWEIYVDVTLGNVTERLVFPVDVD